MMKQGLRGALSSSSYWSRRVCQNLKSPNTRRGYMGVKHTLVLFQVSQEVNANGFSQLKKSGLDFVLLRPRLTMAKKAPVQYFGDDGKELGVFAGMGGVSRASVAACLVDAVEKITWDGTTPVITN
jgi:hypothetical protein